MKKLMILISLVLFALGYLLGAIYWYSVGSFDAVVFMLSVAALGIFSVTFFILKGYWYFLAIGLAGALAAIFPATYWFIDLKLWLGF